MPEIDGPRAAGDRRKASCFVGIDAKSDERLLEMLDRRDRIKGVNLPMSRNDIADYLGLTVETVCRTLSTFRREGITDVPNPHRIALLDRAALEAIGEAQ